MKTNSFFSTCQHFDPPSSLTATKHSISMQPYQLVLPAILLTLNTIFKKISSKYSVLLTILAVAATVSIN